MSTRYEERSMRKIHSRKLSNLPVYKQLKSVSILSSRASSQPGLMVAITLASLVFSPIRGIAQSNEQENRGLRKSAGSTQSGQPNPASSQMKPDLILQVG